MSFPLETSGSDMSLLEGFVFYTLQDFMPYGPLEDLCHFLISRGTSGRLKVSAFCSVSCIIASGGSCCVTNSWRVLVPLLCPLEGYIIHNYMSSGGCTL